MMLHIAKKAEWELAKQRGFYESPSLKEEGFIHCSNETQVIGSANKHFKGQAGLVLLAIDPRKVKAEIKEENLSGGASLFPHIYGRLEIEAVTAVYPFPPKSDGSFELPVMESKPHDKKSGSLKGMR